MGRGKRRLFHLPIDPRALLFSPLPSLPRTRRGLLGGQCLSCYSGRILCFFWRWSDGKEVIKGIMKVNERTASYPATRVSRWSLFEKRENEACKAFRWQDKTYLYPQDTPLLARMLV